MCLRFMRSGGGREGCVCGESLLMRYASIAMVAGGGGGSVVVGVVGERDDDLFKATRGPHGTSSAGASFLHLFSARLLPLSFFFSLLLSTRVRKVKVTGEAVRLLLFAEHQHQQEQ